MARLGITHFDPERIVWIGAAVLSLGVLLCIPFLWSAKVDLSPFVFVRKKEKKNGHVLGGANSPSGLAVRGRVCRSRSERRDDLLVRSAKTGWGESWGNGF